MKGKGGYSRTVERWTTTQHGGSASFQAGSGTLESEPAALGWSATC